ncbi:MAG: ATP-binding cassette domain-containing protein [Clostridiaceae bacterium]
MEIVEIKNLSYAYTHETIALQDISIDIKQQRKIAILGANGSGKSTLLQHFNGLILPQKGSVKIKGISVCKESLYDIRKIVGIVFDNPDDQLFSTTVYEDVAFGPRNLGYKEEEVEKAVDNSLSLIGIQDLKHRQPYNLSLGQKKKVAIAGVLAMEPEIMIFDEPFSGLDPYSLQQFIYILEKLNSKGRTLIITTHDVDIVYSWADECIILKEGKVLAQGSIDILENEVLMEEAKLKTPNLYEIFSNTSMRPKNINKAKELLTKLFKKEN